MKVYTKIVYDKDDNVIEENSYEYNGPVSQANARKTLIAAQEREAKRRASKEAENFFKKSVSSAYDGADELFNVGDVKKLIENKKLIESKGYTSPLRPNLLHQFASYNTIFTLSGTNERELKSHKFLTNPVHDIIARSGGIGNAKHVTTRGFAEAQTGDGAIAERAEAQQNYKDQYSASIEILERSHDLFIENVNMISTASPNVERGLGNFTKMEFEIHEPYGVTLIEKVNAATGINEYQDYQDAPLLLTIEFKGFDENGSPVKTPPLVRKIPILIARVEFEVNEGGARYSIVAVPYVDGAFDDRFKFPRAEVPVAASTPEQWALEVEAVLADMMEQEIKEGKREIADEYEFNIHADVLRVGREYDSSKGSTNRSSHPRARGQNSGPIDVAKLERVEGSAGNNTTLTKFFEDAIRTQTGYQELSDDFWTTYLGSVGVGDDIIKDEKKLKDFVNSDKLANIVKDNQYVNWFKIKTTVETFTDQFDDITKMHKKRIVYQAVPYKIHVLKLVAPGISAGATDWSKKVHKEYNYIYTGENVDVQGLKILYKTAYYQRNVRNDDKDTAYKGVFEWGKSIVEGVFGKEIYPDPLIPLRQYPSIVKGRNTLDGGKDENGQGQQFYDYLTNPNADMMKIELEILGDPAYICQDMYMPIHQDRVTTVGGDNTYSETFDSFNSDSYQPIFFLNYRLPDDIDTNTGLMFSSATKRSENLFFNGLYQVNKIESKFDNGQFQQTLFCSRFNNQQGVGPDFDVAQINLDTQKLVVSEESALTEKRAAEFKESKRKTAINELKKQLDINDQYKNIQPK